MRNRDERETDMERKIDGWSKRKETERRERRRRKQGRRKEIKP